MNKNEERIEKPDSVETEIGETRPETAELYVALIHSPVYKKSGKVIVSSLTPIDLHDISRTCLTYGVKRYCIVNPLPTMQYLARRVTEFWHAGFGREYNPTRWDAFRIVRVYETLDALREEIEKETEHSPTLVATTARAWEKTTSYSELRRRLQMPGPPVLLLLGTGWGLTEEFIRSCDLVLPPITGPGTYNHLSVRAAAAIILDRLVAGRNEC
ncbi:MAG: RNA methyltransferase [bacterium]